jgi:hypothetical protein
MDKLKTDELIAKYNEGMADPAEIRQLELWIEEGRVDLTQLHMLASLDEQLRKAEVPAPSMRLDEQFYQALAHEKRKLNPGSRFSFSDPGFLFPRLAFSLVLVLAGFAVGFFLQTSGSKKEVSQLTQEVTELKEMMMLSLLEKESASQRIKAVNLTSEMDQVSDKVTNALFTTLNQDENVNVRLAALEALKPYVKQSAVRMRLVESITLQDSPLVQVALAELMAAIQEKKSVEALKQLLESDKTPKEVKTKISESLKILI